MASPVKTRTIPALEVRTQFGQIMKDVQSGRLRVLVEKSGVPMVGIISADEFRRVVAERPGVAGDGLSPDPGRRRSLEHRVSAR